MRERNAEFDLLLSYNRLDSALVDPLTEALRARGLRVLKDDWYLRPGERWPTTLEKDLAASGAVVIAIGRNGLGPWQKREVVATLSRRQSASEVDVPVAVILVLLEEGSKKQVGLTFLLQDVWIEAWHPRAVDLIVEAVQGEKSGELQDQAVADPRTQVCPYRGLGVFREEDAGFYFGREPDLERLIAVVDRHPLAAIVGTSGSGKSSLARAGLVPYLRRPTGERIWQVAQMTPGNDPFLALARALVPLCEPERILTWSQGHVANECDRLAQRLEQEGSGYLPQVLRQILAQEPGTTHLMLLVDQWEEVYTKLPTDGETAGTHAMRVRLFIQMLLESVRDAALQVVLTLRADTWGKVLNDASLAAALPDDAVVQLRALDRPALERVIRSPAEMTGLTVPHAVTDALLDGSVGRRDQLPLLEFALQQLWSRRTPASGELTLDAYHAAGGLDESVAHCAETVYERLDPDERDAVPRMFAALIEVDDRGVEPRVSATLGGLDKETRAVVCRFLEERLLVTRWDWSSGDELVRLAHEALLYHWPRLQAWVNQRRAALFTVRLLQADAQTWLQDGKAPVYLWSHERVREAALALKRLGPEVTLSREESEFLGPVDPAEMSARLERPQTTHRDRALIGKRLAILGDPRTGAGIDASGMPQIDWCDLSGGEVAIQVGRRLLGGTKKRRKRVDSFSVGRYPVTVAQYRAFIEAEDGWRDPIWWRDDLYREPDGDQYEFGRFANHPAVYVSWFDSVAFCRWLSRRLDLAVRLADEWEWQRAATDGDAGKQFPWGADWLPEREPYRANTWESRLAEMTSVGLYPTGATRAGAQDMAGTVWEWCRSKYDKPDLLDSRPDDSSHRSLRGGSWDDDRVAARVTTRLGSDPLSRRGNIGFRVVCLTPIFDD